MPRLVPWTTERRSEPLLLLAEITIVTSFNTSLLCCIKRSEAISWERT